MPSENVLNSVHKRKHILRLGWGEFPACHLSGFLAIQRKQLARQVPLSVLNSLGQECFVAHPCMCELCDLQEFGILLVAHEIEN